MLGGNPIAGAPIAGIFQQAVPDGRGLTAEFAAAVAAERMEPALLVSMDFASGFVRVWTGIGELEAIGYTWAGVGTLGSISPVKETSQVRADGISVGLSGIPSDTLSLALGEAYQGRNVIVYLALFNPAGELIPSPTILFSGKMDVMRLDEGGETASVVVQCENRLIDLSRARVRRYTNEDQKAIYPTDRGLEYVNAIQETEIVWR